MTAEPDRSGEEFVSRAFYDIAQLLDSAEDSETRVIRALERLKWLVPYERCAVLDAAPDQVTRLITPPQTTPEERVTLMARASVLLAWLIEEHRQVADVPDAPVTHLAVPLVGLGEVVGVLLVEASEDVYNARHVRRLSVVAAKLAAYFSMLRAGERDAARTRQLEEARQAAEIANRAKDEFLALISHELRTPLNTILAWLDALRSEQTREVDRVRALDAIERSVRAEAKLIEDLLDLSCIAKATLRLDLRAIQPAQLIRSSIESLLRRASLKSIQLDATLDESVAPLIADPQRFGQIIVNLVSNAIKFTPSGGHVRVHLERAGRLARIRVVDTGAGITSDVLPNLFERFHQADSSSTRAHGGLGAGLALVKDLVQLHGGFVKAESAGEKMGATFTVDLPLAEPAPTTAAPPEQGLLKPAPMLTGVHVLLVDDDQDICEVLQFVLEAQGARVTAVTSAGEALASIERSMPNVLLSDIAMPGQTGYDLMRAIVARKGKGALPAAALSAYAPGQDQQEALASGFSVLLAKPIDPEALVVTVATLVRGANSVNGGVATATKAELVGSERR